MYWEMKNKRITEKDINRRFQKWQDQQHCMFLHVQPAGKNLTVFTVTGIRETCRIKQNRFEQDINLLIDS